jgi:hypothetical protein
MLYDPSDPVITPWLVPLISTFTPGIPWLSWADVTLPLTGICPKALAYAIIKHNNSHAFLHGFEYIFIISMLG